MFLPTLERSGHHVVDSTMHNRHFICTTGISSHLSETYFSVLCIRRLFARLPRPHISRRGQRLKLNHARAFQRRLITGPMYPDFESKHFPIEYSRYWPCTEESIGQAQFSRIRSSVVTGSLMSQPTLSAKGIHSPYFVKGT